MKSFTAQPAQQQAATTTSTFIIGTDKPQVVITLHHLVAEDAVNHISRRSQGTGHNDVGHDLKDSSPDIVSTISSSVQLDSILTGIDKLLVKKPYTVLDSMVGNMFVTFQAPTLGRTTITTAYTQVASGTTSVHTCVIELERVPPPMSATGAIESDYARATASGAVVRVFMYELPSSSSYFESTSLSAASEVTSVNIATDTRQLITASNAVFTFLPPLQVSPVRWSWCWT